MPLDSYFWHIPKTAGMSTWQLLDWAYAPGQVCPGRMWEDIIHLPKEVIGGYRTFRGHFLSYLEPYLGRELAKFTVLRDPTQRTISHYCHARRSPEHPYYTEANSMPLTEFCRNPRTRHMVQNYQCGYLAWRADKSPADVCAGLTAGDLRSYKLQLALDPHPDGFPEPAELFTAALRRLDTFVAVGISERLPESLELIADALGAPSPPVFPRQNVAPNRPSAVDADTLHVIHECTELDQDLYRLQMRLFDESVRASDSYMSAAACSRGSR